MNGTFIPRNRRFTTIVLRPEETDGLRKPVCYRIKVRIPWLDTTHGPDGVDPRRVPGATIDMIQLYVVETGDRRTAVQAAQRAAWETYPPEQGWGTPRIFWIRRSVERPEVTLMRLGRVYELSVLALDGPGMASASDYARFWIGFADPTGERDAELLGLFERGRNIVKRYHRAEEEAKRPPHMNRECGGGNHTTCPGIVYCIPGGYMRCECECHRKPQHEEEPAC